MYILKWEKKDRSPCEVIRYVQLFNNCLAYLLDVVDLFSLTSLRQFETILCTLHSTVLGNIQLSRIEK